MEGGRHSIWQNVLHVVFWRENWLRRVSTGVKPSKEEMAAGNWPQVGTETGGASPRTAQGDEAAWAEARRRLTETQERIGAALANPSLSEEHFGALAYFVPHDCYHFEIGRAHV